MDGTDSSNQSAEGLFLIPPTLILIPHRPLDATSHAEGLDPSLNAKRFLTYESYILGSELETFNVQVFSLVLRVRHSCREILPCQLSERYERQDPRVEVQIRVQLKIEF